MAFPIDVDQENMLEKEVFAETYNNRRVLVTGHTGFKGSWLCKWLEILGAELAGYSLPPSTNPNHFDLTNVRFRSYIHDIRDYDRLKKIFSDFKPEIVFHLAAQPLVLESYDRPLDTFSTNVMGSANVLEASRHTDSVKSVVVVTTDKCYKNNEWDYGYRETDELGGHDPYSSSKACAELVTESYRKSYSKTGFTPLIASARAGNVVGGGDWTSGRVVSDAVIAASKGKKLSIRNPNSSRPWQHVLEPLSGYLLLGQLLLQGKIDIAESWNFGPALDSNLTVNDFIKLVGIEWEKVVGEVVKDSNAKHEAKLLNLDSTKARTILGWQSVWDIKKTVMKTVEWYRMYIESNTVITEDQIRRYMDEAKTNDFVWAV